MFLILCTLCINIILGTTWALGEESQGSTYETQSIEMQVDSGIIIIIIIFFFWMGGGGGGGRTWGA